MAALRPLPGVRVGTLDKAARRRTWQTAMPAGTAIGRPAGSGRGLTPAGVAG
jgi:hypothetical protein